MRVLQRSRFNHVLRGAGLSAALFLLVSCSSDRDPIAPSTPSPEGTSALEQPNGGWTATNETPAFGDADLLASGIAEDADDSALDLLEIGPREPGGKLYAVTIRWGQLDQDDETSIGRSREEGDTFDWSGSLETTRGGIGLLRTLRFEPEDHIVRPRANRQTLAWISHTGEGADGIRVLVYEPPPVEGESSAEVCFRTPLLERCFATEELADLDLMVDIEGDVAGNRVHFTAWLVDTEHDVRGFLGGRWQGADGDSVGHFSGRWVGNRGQLSGFLRGIYGTNDAGEQVFYGKYIDRSGLFRGFVRGSWEETESTDHGTRGRFVGHWWNGDEAHPEILGNLQGRWQRGANGRGRFDGRWCFDCTED